MIKVIKSAQGLFWGIWAMTIIIAMLWFVTRPKLYDVSVGISIGRKAVQQSDQYQYDQYYRVQADEKYADTIVQWLKDPYLVQAIFRQAEVAVPTGGMRSFKAVFDAEKLAPEYINVSFRVERPEDAEKISKSLRSELNKKNAEINPEESDPEWFALVFGENIVRPYTISLVILLSAAAVGGLILAITAVLVRHYWKSS